MNVWVVVNTSLTDDGVNAWVYHEFTNLKVFMTKEAAEKYVVSKGGNNNDREFIIREEVVNS